MHKRLDSFLATVLLLILVLAACSSKEIQVTQIVTEEVEVPVEVEVTRIVTERVEVPVEVTAPPPPPEPVTLTYFTFSAAPDHLGELDQMIQSFEAAHPDIEVQVETAAQDDYFTRLQTLIVSGAAPDVFELDYENFVRLASQGLLLDLSTLAVADGDFYFYPRAYSAFSYNNLQLGLPATFATEVLFYNKDLFDAAGLDYPSAAWTWDDAVAAAAQLTDAEAGVWGLYSPLQFQEFYKKAAQNGCEFFNADQTRVTINAPACVEALETMLGFIEEGVMPGDADLGGASGGDLFVSGKLGMLVAGTWMFADFWNAPFEWNIQVEPGMQEHATHFFANAVAVFAAARHPEAAWQWAKFFSSSGDVVQVRVDSGWELAALNNPNFFTSYLQQSPPDNRQAVFESLNYAIVPPVIERQSEMQDIVNGVLDLTQRGQLSPQEALNQAKTELEELLR